MATLKAMFKLFDGYSTTIDKINRKTDEATTKIIKASGATDKLNNELEATGASANTASSGIGKIVSVAALLATTVKGMNIVDEFTNTSARLGLITGSLEEQLALQEKIFASANRAKGSYTAMAGAISKMGITAGEAFGSNDELVAFTELIQKGFKVGGAGSTEQSSAMLQLTQAMGAGKLQGDEFRSIMENAPMIADAIAKYTGKSKGELKELSSDGLISSDIIKNAMFMASDDINAKFETLPYTFADTWNRIKNDALQAFQPIIEATSNLVNSDGFIAIVDGLIMGVSILSAVIGGLINFIVGNWPVIQAILLAIGAFLLYQLIGYLVTAIPLLAIAVAEWWAMNAPIVVLIATIAGVIYILQSMGVTFEDIFGFIGGVVGTAIAFIMNLFIFLWNGIVDFINFIGNAFNHPLLAIQILFSSWSSNILGFILEIAQGIENLINNIPGVSVDITSGITGIKNQLDAEIATLKTEADWKEYVKKANYVDYTAAATTGSNVGKDAYGGLSSAISSLTDSLSGTGNTDTSLGDFGTTSSPATVKGTGSSGTVDVNMADGDLQYLRDIAERDYINKFSTATLAPNITVKFGDVHETADANAVAGRIKKILQEEIAMTAEG